MKKEEIKRIVRERYGEIARGRSSCCAAPSSCCTPVGPEKTTSIIIGYSDRELDTVPEGADLGLGCGNPTALASLEEGETVLDLGAGAGLDCFLAAGAVGEKGKVVGVDMTAGMIEKARRHAAEGRYDNVEFRLGEIESLPAADETFDVAISNCVINLSPDKEKVFGEIYRVLKPGGRIMISDIVLLKEIPDSLRESVRAYVGCVAGAVGKETYIDLIETAGFERVEVVRSTPYPIESLGDDEIVSAIRNSLESAEGGVNVKEFEHLVESIQVQGLKPHRR